MFFSCATLPPLSKEKVEHVLIDSKICTVGTVITIRDQDEKNIIVQNLIGDSKLLNYLISLGGMAKIDILMTTIFDSLSFGEVKLSDEDRILIHLKDENNRIVGQEFTIKDKGINNDLDFINLILNNTLSKYKRNKDINESTDKNAEKKRIKRKDYALIFATDKYDNWDNLENPIYDAKAIENELAKLYNFETELIKNPTLETINKKLFEYVKKEYSEKDQLFIYFAGHGDFNETFKEGYIVAKDSKFKDETGLSYYPYNRLTANIDVIPCKHILITTDVCFGGTIDEFISRKTRGSEIYELIDNKEFIERCFRNKTRKFLSSTKKDYVYDGTPPMHSPFAAYFIAALSSCGFSDRILEFNEIIKVIAKLKPEPAWGSLKHDEPGSNFIFIAK